jgi:AcrR family transcriptional regulator
MVRAFSRKQKRYAAKADILDASDTTFVCHGVTGAQTQDIADQAGAHQALLHYYCG